MSFEYIGLPINTRVYNNVMETERNFQQPEPDQENDQSVPTVPPTYSSLHRETPIRDKTPSSSPYRLETSPTRISRTVRPSSSSHQRSFSRSPSMHQSRYTHPSQSPSPNPRRPSSSTNKHCRHIAYRDQITPRDQGDFYRLRQAPVANPTAPCLKPEPYSGSQNWEEYLSHFEDCAELSDWDSHSKVLFLAASLRGPSRTYYINFYINVI